VPYGVEERPPLASAGNLSQAARALGVDRNTLKRKLAKYGLRDGPESGF
jgi:DNA-binding NtrC family response regulator